MTPPLPQRVLEGAAGQAGECCARLASFGFVALVFFVFFERKGKVEGVRRSRRCFS